jgi:leucyl-tRNA synthetase
MFLQLFKAGLAVRRKAPVNWCPRDQTVLADEQVIDGRCERCSTLVEQRDLEQWFLRITAYAERLLNNLDHLDWSETVKAAQRAWIGRSTGLEFGMPVDGHPDTSIDVFTTRPDTVFGVTYVVLAPEHPLVDVLTTAEQRQPVLAYQDQTRSRSELERQQGARAKSGIFTGAFAVNPANAERVPIWIADYVLASYGTGAIMAVPAHDARDEEFATAFGLPVRQVIVGPEDSCVPPFTGDGMLVDSGPFTGQPSGDAAERISEWFEERQIGHRTTRYRLRDWLVSRQRYWGPPIPIVYCARCGIVPVPEDQLPVLLPDVDDWMPRGTGSSPLAEVPSFVETGCPTCGGPARRETDVSDNFLDSAWYFLRYPSSASDDRAFDPELTKKWLPVDMYIGGAEHSVLHLLYSRFITMVLHELGHLAFEEPFKRFRAHGLLAKNGSKMSKSRGNVVNPDAYFDRLGADTLRMYLVFLGPYERGGEFSDAAIGGIRRFLGRVWDLVLRHADALSDAPAPAAARKVLHETIRTLTRDLENLRLNTAVATLMTYLNTLQARDRLHDEEASALLVMLAPFAPHLAEELWARLGKPYSVHQQPFPVASDALLELKTASVAVQVNGRTHGLVQLSADASEAQALEVARGVAAARTALEQPSPPRVVYVPRRIINIVTN